MPRTANKTGGTNVHKQDKKSPKTIYVKNRDEIHIYNDQNEDDVINVNNLFPHLCLTDAPSTISSKKSHLRAFIEHLYENKIELHHEVQNDNNSRMKVAYQHVWDFAVSRANDDRNVRSLGNYVTTILDCLLLQGRQHQICAETRARGRIHVDRMLRKTKPQHALALRPDSEARKSPLKALPQSVVSLWFLLGWRISAIEGITRVELSSNHDLVISTPPLKHHASEHPDTIIPCRCAAYRGGERCMTCGCEVPILPIRIPNHAFTWSHHSSHSFRRTLAIALRLAVEYFAFDPKLVSHRINNRLKWFRAGPNSTTATNEVADNLNMLYYYAQDCGGITWDNLENSLKKIALEILIEPPTTNTPGDRLYEYDNKWYIIKGHAP